jgi:hypothetical protein
VNYTNDQWLADLPRQTFCKCQKNNVRINSFWFYENLLRNANFDLLYKENQFFKKFENILIKKDKKQVLLIQERVFGSRSF